MDKSIVLLMLFMIAKSAYMKEKQTEVVDDILDSDSLTKVDGHDRPGGEEEDDGGIEREWNNYDEWELEPASWGPENENTNATVMELTDREIKNYINEHVVKGEEKHKKMIFREEGEDKDYNGRPREMPTLLKKADKTSNNDEGDEDYGIEKKEEYEDSNTESDEEYTEK